MKKLEIGTIVNYCLGKRGNRYEVIKNEIVNNKVEKLFFGRDDNILHTAIGNFDYVLAEYDEKGSFIKNIPCKQDDIERRA